MRKILLVLALALPTVALAIVCPNNGNTQSGCQSWNAATCGSASNVSCSFDGSCWSFSNCVAVPSQPTLTASGASTSSCSLTFSASNVISYDIYFGGVFWTNTTATSATYTGLTALTDYSFYVIAKNPAGSSTASATQICTTWSNPLPTVGLPIKMSQIKATFRCPYNDLGSYYKGGACVRAQDYAPNVPASGPIHIYNFHDAQRR